MKKWMMMLVAALMVLAACNGESQDEEENVETETPVETVAVKQEDFTETRSFSSRIMPNDQSPVMAQAAGEVEEVMAERGETVEEDDVLLEYQTQRGLLELVAPMDGLLTDFNYAEGDMLTTEEPAGMVIDRDPMIFQFQVTQSNRNLFSEGDTVTYDVSQANATGEAEVTYVASSTSDNGMFSVEAEADQPDDTIPSGLTGQIQLDHVVAENALVVPTEAVIERSGQTFVFIMEDGQAKEVNVSIIQKQSAETAIEVEDEQLAADDAVISSGQLTIEDGSNVRVVEEE
ncbi:efflux RND transporter periplasmic adaptor subunit [Alkalibacillus salilacus]|uniref:Pyruvate/2-oxoglutarate dehydrogenase complex dihydrolipoamide acyltransferase (E2) component n=1 Tax=Alkalibacillus salilacus TaxID=284582 RepID=A0ABT9VI51_9BACI|nr:HlyD family efflux transporter periplasmic adaptor subunit [Alkalibacillus salilacus]MDQ0160520.1 pyruvate/2-oxoglutarate dehydrogenase complex dihydrolipoamide acyltransferase (E2) component [Alkalibacillus salilacus]